MLFNATKNICLSKLGEKVQIDLVNLRAKILNQVNTKKYTYYVYMI